LRPQPVVTLIKPVAPSDLEAQIRKAVARGLAVCVRAKRLLLESLRRMADAGAGLGLSWREQESMFCQETARARRESAVRVFTTHFRGGNGRMRRQPS